MESFDASSLTQDQLSQLLGVYSMSIPDNNHIKQSTDLLKKYSDNIISLEGFLTQITSNQDAKARQLSAVLLYKTIEKHWHKLTNEQKDIISSTVITAYQNEKIYLALRGLSNIIFKIAKMLLLTKEWKAQFDFIFSPATSYQSEHAQLFELNLHIIAELLNSSMEYIKPQLQRIKEILSTALTMGSQRMKENATQCLGSLIANLEKEELESFKDLGLIMFTEMKKFSDKTIMKCYETLCDFQINSFYFFEKYFDQIVPLTLELIVVEEYSAQMKSVLAEFLLMIAQYKKKIFTQNNCDYLKKFIQIAFKLVSSEDNEQETDVYNESTEFQVGLNMINMITNTISSKHTFPLYSELIKTCIQSKDGNTRRATIAIIGEISEGCSTAMKDDIENVINSLINTFYNDTNEKVKSQCIIAMDLVSQFCAPEINEYYDKIIPMLYQGLFSTNEDIIEKSLIEINYFCSDCDFEIEDYLNMNIAINQNLLSKIIEILNATKSMRIQDKSLDALGSVIRNAKNMLPEILLPILETLKQITLSKTTVNDQSLIGSTLNCVSNIILVVKNDKFAHFESYFSSFAFECIKSSVYELQFGGLSYFGSLADIKQKAFAPYLDTIMENTFRILKDNSGIVEKNKAKDEIGLDSDSEDEMEGNGDVYWNEEFINTKYTAIKVLGSFGKACPVEYIKFFKEVLVILEEFNGYVCESVIFAVVETYEELLLSLEGAVKGILEGNIASTLQYDIQSLWVNEVFPKYEEIINSSDDQELVAKTMESIYATINHFGKDIFTGNNTLQRSLIITKKLLNNEMTCQIKNEDADEEEMDHEEEIFESVQNLFLILAEKLGDEFHPFFTELFPTLQKYLKTSRPEEDRSLAFGCIAEVLKFTKISAKFYLDILFKSIEENLQLKKTKKNEQLLRHIAYLLGILFSSEPTDSLKYLNAGLNNLQMIFEKSKKDAKDNVISALARIIPSLRLTKESFPLFDKTIETIMNSVPLKYDPLENITLIDLFIYLTNIFSLDDYTKYLNSIMKIANIIIVNDLKCNTKPEDITKVKGYLETLMKNATIKEMIDSNISKTFTENEKKKFIEILSK